ncbi:hypothetical protein K3495_g13340 [Podosphaera aphanis]|nr:hypothetical protein K3495_g13340 [Podosphaera aphanis]
MELEESSYKNIPYAWESETRRNFEPDAGPSQFMPGSGLKGSKDQVPVYPEKRRPRKRQLSQAPQELIDEWFQKTGVKLGELSNAEKNKVTRLLHTYQDLNSTELDNLPFTDLYVHRVRLKEGTPPFSRPKQRRWPPGKEFWMKRIITDGLRCGLYESTIKANGHLSDWNAMAQLVDKSDEPGEWDEPRLTFNYQNVVEDKPGCFVELMSRCHDYLGHPDHNMFFKMDLKNGYWAILVHPEDRHYFAFSMPGMGQLQPTRMPQGSCSASFSFTELMYLVLGQVPGTDEFPGMESILIPKAADLLPDATFYIDDIFSGFKTFEQGYRLLENELLPRLSWAKLRLSFKKLELFVTSTVALGVTHKAGGKLVTKTERCEKIRKFPVPENATDVRKFIGAIGITRNWVKNFAEIKRPLTRLTGNAEFVWGAREQASFQLLKEKCAHAVEMHGWDFSKPVKMYSDASLYGAGCAITQERIQNDGKVMEVPIIYDAFTFSKSQFNYGMYKKELCAIVEFSRKYEHMLKSMERSVILTDHKPLTYFLTSSMLDGIYARWASELRCLGVEIKWIPGKINEVADALSRTIFPDSSSNTPPLEEFGEMISEVNMEPLWVWKDGKGGYEELLKKVAGPLADQMLEELFVNKNERDRVSENANISLRSNLGRIQMQKPQAKYLNSEWYEDISRVLAEGNFPDDCNTKIQRAALIRKAQNYEIADSGDIYIKVRGTSKKCIVAEEVASILRMVHDEGGHISQVITLRKLKKFYWPRMAVDVRDYIKGCLVCAKFGTAIRSQTSARVAVSEPMELLGIDFIGPFPKFEKVSKRYILIAVDYFSRYIWAEAVERNDSDTVINFLEKTIFEKFGIPVGLYMDPGPHFGEKTRRFAESCGTLWCNSPVAAKRAVGMIEKAVDILQRVLKKVSPKPQEWPERISKAIREMNKREIAHLSYSPSEILLGFNPVGPFEVSYPLEKRESLTAEMKTDLQKVLPEEEEHGNQVIDFIAKRIQIQKKALEHSDWYKNNAAERHNLGIRGSGTFSPGELVMLYDHQQARKKLRPAWRGPFVIVGLGGDMGRSYKLRQINGAPIPRHYHGDSLKTFRLREGYLITGEEEALPVFQSIRLGNASFKLPKNSQHQEREQET